MAFSIPFLRPSAESLVKQLKDLPPAPKVLLTLRRLLAEHDTTIEAIAEVVNLEPGLSARVVRMANSAHFGGTTKVDSVKEGIQRVGLKGVQELVTYAVASQLVGQPLNAYAMSAQKLWLRAVACAMAAGALAERASVNREDAYTAGLMHGLGLLVIDRHATKQRRKGKFASSGYPLDFAPAERDWLGFSHAEAGAALLDAWDFPAPAAEAVRYQLEPEQAPVHRKLAMILATARWARSLFCVAEEKIPELPSPHWLEEAEVDIPDFNDWLRLTRTRFTLACDEMRLA
ncbi:MAG: HDOD domain-containing protein [Opitutaceae bacterium]|nr:HDOD domain-containing protein [Opitutaceae bacterium]